MRHSPSKPPLAEPEGITDTSRQANAIQRIAYQRMGGAGRAQVVFRLNRLAREATMAGIRSRHPDYDDEQVRSALFRILLGDELAQKVWPARELVAP